MELQEEIVEARTTALALDLAIQESEKESTSNYKDRALETLAKLAENYMTPPSITSSGLKEIVKNHPEILDELMLDEELVGMISQRIMSASK